MPGVGRDAYYNNDARLSLNLRLLLIFPKLGYTQAIFCPLLVFCRLHNLCALIFSISVRLHPEVVVFKMIRGLALNFLRQVTGYTLLVIG